MRSGLQLCPITASDYEEESRRRQRAQSSRRCCLNQATVVCNEDWIELNEPKRGRELQGVHAAQLWRVERRRSFYNAPIKRHCLEAADQSVGKSSPARIVASDCPWNFNRRQLACHHVRVRLQGMPQGRRFRLVHDKLD